MFLFKTNVALRALYPRFRWRVKTQERVIYLTFDDGPIPEITEFVLDTLNQYQAKATFFCIGDNVGKYPAIFQQILTAGHAIGNHTFNHLNGWKTDDPTYLDNIHQCQRQFGLSTQFFRPPYGRIKRSQATKVLETHEVIMWDVLTGDFSVNLDKELILRKTIRHSEPGSILLFHDSVKAWPRMNYVLPRLLTHFSDQGFRFDALS